jgi:hypothetical protein
MEETPNNIYIYIGLIKKYLIILVIKKISKNNINVRTIKFS